MYLIHNTTCDSIKFILKDHQLKSFSILKKEGTLINPEEGDGLYIKNNFVYFSCTEKLFDTRLYGDIILYIDPKILLNKSFYVSTMHTIQPKKLSESYGKDENSKRTHEYTRKYSKNYRRYKYVLNNLYKKSISHLQNGHLFQIFQQVAVEKMVKLDELVAIDFKFESHLTHSMI
jgi:hypothetical protein